MSPRENGAKSTSKLRLKDWLAIAAFVFGVVQCGVSVFLEMEKSTLQRALEEEKIKNQIRISFYRFDNKGLERLYLQLHSPDGQSSRGKRSLSIVELDNEGNKDDLGRYGGSRAFREIHEMAVKDPPQARDQMYWFMAIRNGSSEVIDALHVRFKENNQQVIVKSVGKEEVVLVPVEVSGRHANLTRTKTLSVIEAQLYITPERNSKPIRLELPQKGSLRSGEWQGAWQALPDF